MNSWASQWVSLPVVELYIGILVSQFNEMWQEAEKSPVIPLMTAKDAVWDTYIIVFFPTNAAGLSRKKDVCMLSSKVYWESDHMDSSQDKK